MASIRRGRCRRVPGTGAWVYQVIRSVLQTYLEFRSLNRTTGAGITLVFLKQNFE